MAMGKLINAGYVRTSLGQEASRGKASQSFQKAQLKRPLERSQRATLGLPATSKFAEALLILLILDAYIGPPMPVQ